MREQKKRIHYTLRNWIPHELNTRAELLLKRRVPLEYGLFVACSKEEVAAFPELHVVAQEAAGKRRLQKKHMYSCNYMILRQPGCGTALDKVSAEQRHLRVGQVGMLVMRKRKIFCDD
jgi:hypothetical protein